MAGTIDSVWRGEGTSPDRIEAALRDLLSHLHRQNEAYVPARVLNLVAIVDKGYSGEIANRLRGVGRYHASRTIICQVEPRRTSLDATATLSAPAEVRDQELGVLRETVVVDVGPAHLGRLDRIVDPLVVPDLPTAVWAPHGHDDGLESLLGLAQVVLIDTSDAADPQEAVLRTRELAAHAYIVDLSWLRSTPWRERIAATFDPPRVRGELGTLSAVTIRHHPDSELAGLLLVGWLASRLGWRPSPLVPNGQGLVGTVHGRRQDVRIRLEPDPTLSVRGLQSFTAQTAGGRAITLERGQGGLHATAREARGPERTWTLLGASRGEAGILGEGIRQALLRDPTYGPALSAADALLPAGRRTT